MSDSDHELIDGVIDAGAAFAALRDYLETEVDWTPVIPPPGELERDERWERICSLLLQQLEDAGRAAIGGVSAIQAWDRDGALTGKLRLLEAYFEENDYASGLALFAGEDASVLIRMANNAFAEGEVADAKQIFAFAHLANPLMVEPLIGRLTVEWEERGAARAADLYAAVVDVMRNPMLDLFAADCMREAGRGDAADALLQRALKQIDEDEEIGAAYGDLRDDLRAAMTTSG